MNDYTRARRPSWRYTLLDSQDRPLGQLDGVTSGSLEVAATTRLGGSGQLTIDERGQDIDWMSHRVRCTYDPGITGLEPWDVATMMLSTPVTTYGERTSHSVDLLPKMSVIDEDAAEARFSLAAGAPIIASVVALIQSTGETRIAATESSAVLSSPMVWPAAESKLTIINDLLAAAGYWSLWCDGGGQFRVEPYTPPGDRTPSWEFAAGEAAIHQPGWQREQDLSSVPNRFIVVGQGNDQTPALTAVATNEDPDSPFSYQARGRWITRSEEGAEGAQSVLDALAQRRLLDAMSPVGKLAVTHAIVPLDPNQVVTFSPLDRDPVRATIQRMAFSLEFDGQCQAEWREI